MIYLTEEVGTKSCIVGKIGKSRVKWAGHMIRMKDERLPNRYETKKQEGCRKPATLGFRHASFAVITR